MTEDIKGRFKISISHGLMSATFTRDGITILEARDLAERMAKVLFQIEDSVTAKNVRMNLEELARYEEAERLRK